MKLFRKFLMIGAAVALLGVMAPVIAQEEGQGGIIIEGNFAGDPATFNPVIAGDVASARVSAFLFPGFLSVDPSQGIIAPESELAEEFQGGSLVDSYTISEDGTVYTFTLRQDAVWNDGTPITSADVMYTWGAIQAGVEGIVDTPLTYVVDPSGATGILDVQALDDYTVQVTFATAECTALAYASALAPLPSHVLPADYNEFNDDPFNLNPTVTAGIFNFGEYRAGEQVSLVANTDYYGGDVIPEGWIYSAIPDNTVLVESFLAGQTNVIDNPLLARRGDIEAQAAAGEVTTYEYPSNVWIYFAFNLADPNNPQPAFDADGNAIDQGNHPIFGDVRVRQAVALGVDMDAIVESTAFGRATRMASVLTPSSWAYDASLAPIAHDPEAAMALLDEAGWVDADNDPATPRVAQGAMFVEDGTELRFSLLTAVNRPARVAAAQVMVDQLAQIGIGVDFSAIEFNTLVDVFQSQTFDAFIGGWRAGYPDDPDLTQLFLPAGDIPGSGSNYMSYNNPEVTRLNNEAKAVPGCAQEDRAALYAEIQAIMQQDLPYLWMYQEDGMYAARTEVGGFDPYPAQLYWNIQAWNVAN